MINISFFIICSILLLEGSEVFFLPDSSSVGLWRDKPINLNLNFIKPYRLPYYNYHGHISYFLNESHRVFEYLLSFEARVVRGGQLLIFINILSTEWRKTPISSNKAVIERNCDYILTSCMALILRDRRTPGWSVNSFP